jgi:hypothetical protein
MPPTAPNQTSIDTSSQIMADLYHIFLYRIPRAADRLPGAGRGAGALKIIYKILAIWEVGFDIWAWKQFGVLSFASLKVRRLVQRTWRVRSNNR